MSHSAFMFTEKPFFHRSGFFLENNDNRTVWGGSRARFTGYDQTEQEKKKEYQDNSRIFFIMDNL
jgi:hypothetical protein